MIFRSQTDEQLAAKRDPAPWIGGDGVRERRDPLLGHPYAASEFAPRVELIPSRDPEPWSTYESYDVDEIGAVEYEYRSEVQETPEWTWSPRPQFARPPVNRALTAFREYACLENFGTVSSTIVAGHLNYLEDAFGYTAMNDGFEAEECDHARRVLAKWLGVFA